MAAKEDRISNLPDDIIHRILSFLDVTYAIETRKLSKKWKHIWTSMPYLNLNSQTVGNLPKLSKFVKHETSLRYLVPAVSAVELSFKGSASQLVGVVISIVKYLYSHNINQLTMIWSEYTRRILEFPWLFRSHTLKHLTLATTSVYSGYHARSVAVSTWDFPVLETLNLSNIPFADKGDRSLNLFSKCVNLKDLTLHHCAMSDMDIFNVCAPRLSNLTITDPDGFPKVFRVVAPQLENLTTSVNSIKWKVFYFLQLSTSGLDRLEKVDLSLPRPLCEKERYAPRLLDLFHKLRAARFLILDMGIIEALSLSLNEILHEPCPFNNLKCLRIKTVPLNHIPIVPTQVINYLLKSSPSATFIMDLPQVSHKISREEVDKDNMAKKMARLDEEKQQQKTMVEETRSRHKALSSLPNQLSHEPSLFNNSKCLSQTEDHIPRMPTQERNYLHQSSLSTSLPMGLPQKITRQEVDMGTVPKKLVNLEEEKQQLETMTEEKRLRNKALPSCLDQLSHEPSPFNQLLHEPSSFNNLKRFRQVDSIPRMPTQVRSYLHESTPSTTFLMDLPQSQKRSKHEVEKGTMLEEEKLQTETMIGYNIRKVDHLVPFVTEPPNGSASKAKQDRSINNKHRASIIAKQMDVVHDDRASIFAGEDRISNLPNEIIHHILSFLDMKYAVQTSALSKRWKHIWTSMTHLNLNSRTFRTSPKFVKFVNDALSHLNHHTEVSAVELSFRGSAIHFDAVVRSIVNYAYSRNARKLTLIWFRFNKEVLMLPQRLFSCHTLKHLTLATNCVNGCGLSVPESAWDFPALETLNLRYIQLSDNRGDKSLNLFSKCVNLKDFTLHGCDMRGLDILNVCAPRLSNHTITDPYHFPKVFNVVAPKLKSLTTSAMDTNYNLLQLSVEDLDSLEKVNISVRPFFSEVERYALGLLDLFQKLCGAKFLILDNSIIGVLSACRDQLLDEPCPFKNLKYLKIDKQKNRTATMPTHVKNYFLESSPSVTFIMDLPQGLSSCTKQLSHKASPFNNLKCSNQKDLPQVPHKRSRKEVDKGNMAKKGLSSCTEQLSRKGPPFNNVKCSNQKDRIPLKLKNHLLKSSPSATSNKDLLQVTHKRPRQEVDNSTMANTLEEEKQQTKTMDEEKRTLEAKISRQDELIAEHKTMLEAMKVQHEKKMLEAKIHMQDEIIAHQKNEKKAMLEATKLLHENRMLEEKLQKQDKMIAEQKAMLEIMKLQNEKKMFEEKIQRQDKIIAKQKAMLEAMKLRHEKNEMELRNIDG